MLFYVRGQSILGTNPPNQAPRDSGDDCISTDYYLNFLCQVQDDNQVDLQRKFYSPTVPVSMLLSNR
jgi:hypothetical protein